MTEREAIDLAQQATQFDRQTLRKIFRVSFIDHTKGALGVLNPSWSVVLEDGNENPYVILIDTVTAEIRSVSRGGDTVLRPPKFDPGLPLCSQCECWLFPERNQFPCQASDLEDVRRRLETSDIGFFRSHHSDAETARYIVGVYQCARCFEAYITVLSASWPVEQSLWRDVSSHAISRLKVDWQFSKQLCEIEGERRVLERTEDGLVEWRVVLHPNGGVAHP